MLDELTVEQELSYYICGNVALNGYIRWKGIPYVRVKRFGREVFFYYEKTEQLHKVVNQFLADKNIRDFLHNYNEVRNMLRNIQ